MDDLFQEGSWKIIKGYKFVDVVHACVVGGFSSELPFSLGVMNSGGACHLCKVKCPEKIKTLYVLLHAGLEYNDDTH